MPIAAPARLWHARTVRRSGPYWCLVTLVLAGGCLGETLMGDYDNPTTAAGGAERSYYPLGGSAPGGGMNRYLPGANVRTIPVFVAATGSTTGTPLLGGGAGAVDSSQAGMAASVDNSRHYLRRYLAGDWDERRLVGITGSDHLIAAVSVRTWDVNGVAGPVIESEHALLEALPSGDVLREVVFWCRMPDVLAVSASGEVALAGQLDYDVFYDATTLQKQENAYFVTKLDADWGHVFSVAVTTDTQLVPKGIVFDDQGGVHVAASSGDVGVPDLVTFLTGFAPDGKQMYRSTVIAQAATAVAFGADGLVDWVGMSSGSQSFEVASLDIATGLSTVGHQLSGAGSGYATSLAVLSKGHWRIGGQALGWFGVATEGSALGKPFVADVDQRQTNWVAVLGETGTVNDLVQRGDRSYVAGYLGQAARGSQSLFAAEIGPDGTTRSLYTIPAGSPLATAHLAVDSKGVIWLSGEAYLARTPGTEVLSSSVLLQLEPN